MNKIFLIRHSKSVFGFATNDFERNLTEEGRMKALKIALKTLEYIPNEYVIYSSSAVRAKETAEIIVAKWGIDLNAIIFNEDLYTFDCNKLVSIIQKCPNEHKNLILFGHNSAITDFVNKFGDVFIDNVPTAGFVSINFETDHWNEISKGKTDKIIFSRDF